MNKVCFTFNIYKDKCGIWRYDDLVNGLVGEGLEGCQDYFDCYFKNDSIIYLSSFHLFNSVCFVFIEIDIHGNFCYKNGKDILLLCSKFTLYFSTIPKFIFVKEALND